MGAGRGVGRGGGVHGEALVLSLLLAAGAVFAFVTPDPAVGGTEERQNVLLLAEPVLLVLGVLAAQWLLKRLYRAAVLRQMRRPSDQGLMRATAARLAARRQALARWFAVVIAALVQDLALGLFGGVTLNENPGQPLVR